MTRCQERLYAYIRTLLFHADAARDVLQETNVVLLRKADELRPGQNFDAWACRIAYYEVLSYRRDKARDRHLFDESLVDKLVSHAETSGSGGDARIDALRSCLDGFAPAQRELIAARYSQGGTLKDLAAKLSLPARTLATQLFRLRKVLLDCIDRKLSMEDRGS